MKQETEFPTVAAQPSVATTWTITYPQVKALAAELIKAAESMGSEAHDSEYEGEELVLQVRQPGTISNDDGSLNERPLLAISLFDYPEEGVYPIDPTECPTPPADRQVNGTALTEPQRKALRDAFQDAFDRDKWFGVPHGIPQPQEIPEGYKLVPIEPTEEMIVDGFESAPDEHFTPIDEWERFQSMSGCQQAAHKAKLCWEAMIKAAPEQKLPVLSEQQRKLQIEYICRAYDVPPSIIDSK